MDFSINFLKNLLVSNEKIVIPAEDMKRVEACFRFLQNFSAHKIIYGINTGFGPMAQWKVEDSQLRQLQYNLISSHATGAGKPMGNSYVKACMYARLGSLMQAKSGIHPSAVSLLADMLNHDIIPFVPEHGSVGASGDLVQLAHIALCMIGKGKVYYQNSWQPSDCVFRQLGIKPLEIFIREGLCIANGTSMMTGISAINQIHAENLLQLATLCSVWMNEIAGSYDDLMAAPLHEARRHKGQIHIAQQMRNLAQGSQRLNKREHELYNGNHQEDVFLNKVQAYYSLRCTPQILGPIYDTLIQSRSIIEDELNAVSDNPIVDPESNNVYHGGNFHGDYISLEADKMKIAMVRLAMTAERQLNYLLNDKINGILPPFLNRGVLGLNYGFQACQFTATSTVAECQTLAMPNYVHSIPNNNDNQDIVSMGTNSAELCALVIENAYQVMTVLMLALAQATDCLSIQDQLAPATKKYYEDIRAISKTIIKDRPLYEDIENVENHIKKI